LFLSIELNLRDIYYLSLLRVYYANQCLMFRRKWISLGGDCRKWISLGGGCWLTNYQLERHCLAKELSQITWRDAVCFAFKRWKMFIMYFSIVVWLLLCGITYSNGWVSHLLSTTLSLSQHLLSFGDLIKGNKIKRMWHIIWLVITWCIWRTRNNILFRDAFVNVSSLVNQILYILLGFGLGRLKNSVDFSFLVNNTLVCIHRI
jgi:hypothetical protein